VTSSSYDLYKYEIDVLVSIVSISLSTMENISQTKREEL